MKKTLLTVVAGLALAGMASCSSDGTSAAGGADATKAVVENIMTRASVRQFTDKAIPKDTLEQIVRCGMAAPSAANAQPWAFVVVTDKAVLDSLSAIADRFRLETATAAIIVCGDMSRALEGPGREYWVQDCSAVTENILLATHAYGLGAVWCGVYHGPESEEVAPVSKVLGLPENIIPLDVITMGFPAGKVEPKDKWKPELIHYDKW